MERDGDCQAERVSAELDQRPIDELVNAFAEQHHCPTVAWGVVGDGSLIASGSVGDVTERTVYRIASMTKAFSAAATLWLRDAGVLRLDDPIDAARTRARRIEEPHRGRAGR